MRKNIKLMGALRRTGTFMGTLAFVGCFATHALAQQVPGPAPAPAPAPTYPTATPSPVYPAPQPAPAPQQPAPVAPAPQPAPVVANGPRIIQDYHEGDPVPPGYRTSERSRRGLVIAGAIIFASVYSLNVLVAAANDDVARSNHRNSDTDALYIPVIGPFVQIAAKNNSATGNVFLTLDGAAQAGGVAMFILGLTMPKTVLVRETAQNPFSLHVAPLLSRQGTGMNLFGTF